MKLFKYVGLVGVLAGLFLLQSSIGVARPLDCAAACDWSTPCSTICWAGGMMTCHEWGVCKDLACTPQWVETGRVSVGGYQKCASAIQFPAFLYCKHFTVYDVTLHDVNGCYGDRVTCREVYDELRYGFSPEEANSCDWWSNTGPWGKGICGGRQGCR